LPIIDSLKLTGDPVLKLLPQVAIADAACIIALPLAVDPKHAGRAALGSLAVLASATVGFFLLSRLERAGVRQRLHAVSEQHKFALELRISLVILCALAALAVKSHVSIMLAGFSFGLAMSAATAEPRRLARQLFALTEGFLGPLFFVWLGAGLDLRALGSHVSYIGLGVALAAGALLCHGAMRIVGQPLAFSALAAAQLGVPVAAVTVGTQLHVLKAGEPAGLILAALLTIAVSTVAAGAAARSVADTGTSAGTDKSPSNV